MPNTAVDFAAKLISPQAIKDAGHSAVLAYVSKPRPGAEWMLAKPITRDYADECKRVGLDIVSIWQYGKPPPSTAPSDWTTGYDGGFRMGLEARDTHFAIGGTGYTPIYFAVDEDITLDQWNNGGRDFFRGVNDAIGKDWTGIYGSARVCSWAIEDSVIGRSTTEGKYWAWQTKAWSAGVVDTDITLYQRIVDTPATPGPKIDGAAVDVNDILAADFGQWGIARGAVSPTPQPEEPAVADKPAFTEVEAMGNSASSRFGARITNFLLHTQEGDGTAESLARYLNNSANGVSYHYTLRDGILYDVVDTDLSSWSVLDANSSTINLCFADSRASWSRDQWLAREGDIKIAAWVAVQDAVKYGFSTEVIAPPYRHADGISDHKYVTEELGIGNHVDVGNDFPWDVLAFWVRQYADGEAPAPAAKGNAINDCAAANPWLGERVTVGEQPCADKVGRWAKFQNGYVYWHPRVGANAIPNDLFGKYSELNWESGPLGYPVGTHTDLAHGVVQGFEGGALYRKDDAPAFWVHGEIRNAWNRSGFEDGPFGWPTSDESPKGKGAGQTFENGAIYWPNEPTIGLLYAGGPDAFVPDKDV